MVKRLDPVGLLRDLSGNCSGVGAGQRTCRLNPEPAQRVSRRFPRMGENLKSTVTVTGHRSGSGYGENTHREGCDQGTGYDVRPERRRLLFRRLPAGFHNMARIGLRRLPDDEDRDPTVRQHLQGLTAEQ